MLNQCPKSRYFEEYMESCSSHIDLTYACKVLSNEYHSNEKEQCWPKDRPKGLACQPHCYCCWGQATGRLWDWVCMCARVWYGTLPLGKEQNYFLKPNFLTHMLWNVFFSKKIFHKGNKSISLIKKKAMHREMYSSLLFFKRRFGHLCIPYQI